MFSLIITIISIALVAALALATLYFGGDAFNKASVKAEASTIINQASQISGANTLHFSDSSSYESSIDNLVTKKYLSGKPDASKYAPFPYEIKAEKSVVLMGISSDVCQEINLRSGDTRDSIANLAAIPNYINNNMDKPFGCHAVAGNVDTLIFR